MKRILAFILIFILLMSSACTMSNDEESAASIDINDEAEQSNDSTDSENKQTPDTNATVKNPTEQNNQPVQNNTQKDDQTIEEAPDDQQKDPENNVEEEPKEDNKAPVYDDSDATPASSFEYMIKKENKSILIKKFKGSEKEVVIPNYIDGYPVKYINYESFRKTQIESLVISENIECIYDDAFDNCEKLKTVVIKSKKLVIGSNAFRYCSSLNNLTLGNGVIEVGASAFRYCTSLRDIQIPSTLNSCGTGAFGGITIEKLTFADGIEKVGSSGCFVPAYGEPTKNSFKTVIIPASVKTIVTFSFGENLQEITFLGDAPEIIGEEQLLPEKVVVKYKKGSKGWDDPKWKKFNLVEIE